MKRKHPAVVPGSLDPERVGPSLNSISSDAKVGRRFDPSGCIHAYSPYASDRKFGNAVASEWRPAVVDGDQLSFDSGFSLAAIRLCKCNGGECANHCCAEDELLE